MSEQYFRPYKVEQVGGEEGPVRTGKGTRAKRSDGNWCRPWAGHKCPDAALRRRRSWEDPCAITYRLFTPRSANTRVSVGSADERDSTSISSDIIELKDNILNREPDDCDVLLIETERTIVRAECDDCGRLVVPRLVDVQCLRPPENDDPSVSGLALTCSIPLAEVKLRAVVCDVQDPLHI